MTSLPAGTVAVTALVVAAFLDGDLWGEEGEGVGLLLALDPVPIAEKKKRKKATEIRP